MQKETNIFELLNEKYVLPKKVRLFESFSGIGCQRMAFNRLGIEVDMVGISEIDKYAIQSYNAIHGDTKNWGSICDIKGQDLPQIDVFTYSFPCTDLSKAGKQKGLNDTRSGLVYEVLRIIHELKEVDKLPKCLIMENVVDLVQVKFIRQFQEIQLELEKLGYSNYAQTLNAKDYGVAQNRDRIFMVSVLGDKYYEFPKPFKLEKRLKDYLEEKVDERYYLSDVALSGITNALERNGKTLGGEIGQEELSVIQYPMGENAGGLISNITSPTIDGAIGARNTALLCVKDPYILDTNYANSRDPRVYESYCPAINTMGGGNREPKLIEPVCLNSKVNGKQPSLQDRVYDSEAIATAVTTGFMPSVSVIGNYSPSGHNASRIVDDSGLAPAVKENHETVTAINENIRIRKLTPKECCRLMGIYDTDFDKASKVVSNSQLYKQAGNGIVVDVFAAILRKML